MAARVGVDPSVVSRVLNADPTLKITDATRERVLAVVQQLGYRPNALARGLRMATTSALGLVLPEVSNPVYGPIVVGAERRAAEAGYVLILGSGSDAATTEASFARLLHEGRVDALLVASATVEDELLRTLSRGAAPVIAVNRRIAGAVGSIVVDDAAGAHLATRHLIELGHRRIVHVSGPPAMDTTARRQAGYEAAMTEAGLSPRIVAGRGWDATSGHAVAAQALRERATTALFVANIMAAIGVIRAARERGRRVPEDLSVVALHDSPVAEFFEPPLTTVQLPLEALGRASVELVLERLGGGAPRDVLLADPPRLLVRGSTRPLVEAPARRR
ncbi:MAG: LacI family DNA-binding transcriptional regulator [Chloroflexi bacterium]|nr:LacI family DNA-binding transcriptional regulator [Chloroflexota bacterium]